MFGDLMGMMGKLKETQEKVKLTKKRLETVTLQESTPDDTLRIVISASREIREIHIEDSLLQDKEQLTDYLVITLNRALEKAGEIHDAELAAVAKEGMPNIPGLDALM
ncbi:YbaB/EbfC family nucleoid-associated protein [Robiginitalea aurantiaca]|uniref:YbaB/EbfC family nucleoid-associated protein n=1 Tax=Robiginitalea aurantiaca TaxID=3056915 RepID=A0ABT7WG22_9FLAO|nr:YbaB/EbfC family nucleoid-associated protein [Robiginitalea aurantiaca]MDM9631867.1 YbaB/EbfC family nucleoid-associated protein [Robiginitalea aurantiaca]